VRAPARRHQRLAAVSELARRHEHLAAALLYLAVLAVWFFPLALGDQLGQSHVLWGDHPWAAQRPAGLDAVPHSGEGDAATQYQPLLTVAREQLLDGELPLWNPYSYAGMVLHADAQTALLYPLTWLAFVLPVEDAWGLIAVLKLLIAGLGAHAFARALGIGRGGAVAAGLVYMLSAPLVVWLQWSLATVFALLPWLLLASDRVWARRDGRSVALLGLVVALSVFAGHPETTLLSSCAAFVYLAGRAVAERPGWAGAARGAAAWAAGHLLGALIAAAALLPFLEAYEDSITRTAHGDFADVHLPLSSAILYALPHVYGDGKPDYVGPHATYVSAAAYAGVLALLLAGLAAVRRRRAPATAALAAMAVAAFMVGFGVPPVRTIVETVPPLADGNTSRVLYIVALAIAVGAGAGLESLARRPLALRRLTLATLGAGAAVALVYLIDALAGELDAELSVELAALGRFAVMLVLGGAALAALGRLRPPAALALALVVLALDLGYLRGYNQMLPPEQAYPGRTPALDFLAARSDGWRLSVIRPGPFPPYVLPPNTSALYGLEAVQGYDYPQQRRWADFSWFVLGERGVTREIVLRSPRPRGAALTGLRMVGTRWYMARPGAPPPNPGFGAAYRGRDATVFEDGEALPRAWLVGHTRPLGYDATLAELAAGRLDPRREALVPPGVEPVAGGGGARPARVEQVDSQRLRVRLPAGGGGGWLVLAGSYFSAWRAEVDGREADVEPTNLALMGVRVPPGARVVEFRLGRTSLWIGVALSGLGVALAAALWLVRRRA
jgi:Bacterial membrane protein YfhO